MSTIKIFAVAVTVALPLTAFSIDTVPIPQNGWSMETPDSWKQTDFWKHQLVYSRGIGGCDPRVCDPPKPGQAFAKTERGGRVPSGKEIGLPQFGNHFPCSPLDCDPKSMNNGKR